GAPRDAGTEPALVAGDIEVVVAHVLGGAGVDDPLEAQLVPTGSEQVGGHRENDLPAGVGSNRTEVVPRQHGLAAARSELYPESRELVRRFEPNLQADLCGSRGWHNKLGTCRRGSRRARQQEERQKRRPGLARSGLSLHLLCERRHLLALTLER